MEEQLALIEKLKDVGIELSPEERLENIEQIEQFLQTLNEVDKTLERRRQAMLRGKRPEKIRTVAEMDYDLDRMRSEFIWFMSAVLSIIAAARSHGLIRLGCIVVALVCTVAVVWQIGNTLSAVAISFFRKRLVRSTKEYGQIIEAQAKLKELSVHMKLKQLEFLTKT